MKSFFDAIGSAFMFGVGIYVALATAAALVGVFVAIRWALAFAHFNQVLMYGCE